MSSTNIIPEGEGRGKMFMTMFARLCETQELVASVYLFTWLPPCVSLLCSGELMIHRFITVQKLCFRVIEVAMGEAWGQWLYNFAVSLVVWLLPCYMDFILKDGSEYDIGGPIGRCDHYVVVGIRLAIFTTIDAESCDWKPHPSTCPHWKWECTSKINVCREDADHPLQWHPRWNHECK